jgi:hypothetical protein
MRELNEHSGEDSINKKLGPRRIDPIINQVIKMATNNKF